MRAFVKTFGGAIAACALAGGALGEERLALVIGNEDYPREVGRLANPHEDAARIAAALEDVGFSIVAGGVVRDADQARLNRAILEFQDALVAAGADGVGFFYYSGQGGSTEARGRRRNYLVPARSPITRADQLPFLGVELGAVIDSLAATQAKAVFVVSDACRNTLPWTSNLGGAQPDRGFVAEAQRAGLFIAHATAEGETAPDDGAFARALSERLATPGVYAPRAFALAFREVAASRDVYRRPVVSDQLTTDICFVSCPGESPPPADDVERAQLEERLAALEAENARLAALEQPEGFVSAQAIVDLAQSSGVWHAGETFRDCAACPEMVVIPAGSFTMGSPASEERRGSDEGPQRTVRIASFAAGKYEVTWDEWDGCVRGGGCDASGPQGAGGDEGWGRGSRPAINVSWNDAQAYVRWLSRETGQTYRLLTEAEWEYAARAGTTTAYWWGDSASHEYANYGTDECCDGLASGRDQWVNTAPVGSFSANAFGLHDMHGNVYEWVQDCYHESYVGAPIDGAAWTNGCESSSRVLRGGSWNNSPRILRSALRYGNVPTIRYYSVGFRVARTL